MAPSPSFVRMPQALTGTRTLRLGCLDRLFIFASVFILAGSCVIAGLTSRQGPDPLLALATAATPSPVPTATPSPPPTPSPSATPATEGRIVNTGGQGVNLRASPSMSATVVTILPETAPIVLAGPPRDEAGLRWFNVRTRDGRSGWVSSGYVALELASAPTGAGTPGSVATSRATVPVPTARGTSTPTPVPTPLKPQTVYAVRDGDTLSSIAERFGVEPASIAAANEIKDARLFTGQVLLIPGRPDQQ